MENAADALKIAAFTLLFIGTLSIAMMTLSKAKEASEAIIHAQDERNYYSFVSDDEVLFRADEQGNRKVTVESIIPTLYRYAIENYRIEFYQENGTSELQIINRPSRTGKEPSYVLDLAEEQNPTISDKQRKNMIDELSKKLMEMYGDRVFLEKLGVFYEEDELEGENATPSEEDPTNANKTKKRIIQYVLQ